MTLAVDLLEGDGINTVFQTSENYSPNTITGLIIHADNTTTPIVTIIELGLNYIQLNQTVALNDKLRLEYEILGTLDSDPTEEFDLKERLRKLENAVIDLYTINKALEAAINNRVNITAFKAWTKLIEKKTGIKLVETNLGHISSELFKN